MARSTATIFTQIVSAFVSAMAAIGIVINPLVWSRRNKQQLALQTFASATNTFEQIYDAYTADVENILTIIPPQTPQWVQNAMLLFQFNATAPQVLTFNTLTGVPAYPGGVIAADQIINFCSVVPGVFGTTLIKVATNVGGLPAQIDNGSGAGAFPGSLAAASSYAKLLFDPSITVNVVSNLADVFYCYATIFYQGGYSAIIAGNVQAAITNYLNSIPFNGFVTLSDLEGAIKAVPGVNDVVFTNVQAGANGTAYGSGAILVSGINGAIPTGNILKRNYSTVAGYISAPATGPYVLANTLTFVSQ
jgi:hypothetical protein